MVLAFFAPTSGAITEVERSELSTRCFVWRPENCREGHKRADDIMVKAVTRGFTRTEAAKPIVRHAWTLLQEKKDGVKALIRFNQAIVLDGKMGEAWWGAGTAAADLGLWEDAEKCLRKAVGFDKRLAGAHFNLARLLFSRKQDMGGAEESARSCIKADSTYRDCHKLLSLIHFNGNQFAEAKKDYDMAVQLGAEREPELERKLERALATKK